MPASKALLIHEEFHGLQRGISVPLDDELERAHLAVSRGPRYTCAHQFLSHLLLTSTNAQRTKKTSVLEELAL